MTVSRGVRASWFEEAIRTIPVELWRRQLTELPKYLPANFLPRQATSSQPSVPPSTGASSSIPISHTASSSAQPPPTIQLEERPTVQVHVVDSRSTIPEPATAIIPVSTPQIQSYSGRPIIHTPAPPVPTALASFVSSTSAVPVTPERKTEQQQPTSRTPQQADKRRLAYDILRSLGRPIPTMGSKPASGKTTKTGGEATLHVGTIRGRSAESPSPTVQPNEREQNVSGPAGNDITGPSVETEQVGNQATSRVGPQEPAVQPIMEVEQVSDLGPGTELPQEAVMQPMADVEHVGGDAVSEPGVNDVTELPQEPTMQSIAEIEQIADLAPGGNAGTELPQEAIAQLNKTSEETEQERHQAASPPGLGGSATELGQEPLESSRPPPISAIQPALEQRISTPLLALPPYEALSQQAEPVLPEVQVAATIDGPMVIDLTLDEMDSERSDFAAPPQERSHVFPRSPSGPQHGRRQSTPTPQFGSLSLEEQHVEPHAAMEDVRMATRSPSAAEFIPPVEDDGPAVEPVEAQESFRVPSPMEEQHAANDRLPLFLPSPPGSPLPEWTVLPPRPDTDEDDVVLLLDNTSSSPASRKRRSVERDVIDVDEDPLVSREKKRRKKHVYVLVPSPPPYAKSFMERWKRRERAATTDVDTVSASTNEDAGSERMRAFLAFTVA